MAALVIAGSGRGSGKTAVGCALIQAIPELRWLAVKVSPHTHGIGDDVWEERDPNSPKDTGRYLAAGAERAFLVADVEFVFPVPGADMQFPAWRSSHVKESMQLASETTVVLVESGRLGQATNGVTGPVVRLAVLSPHLEEWKDSTLGRLASMDALISTQDGVKYIEWKLELGGMRTFALNSGEWSLPALTAFVRERLLGQ